jgi:hypothetical protein
MGPLVRSPVRSSSSSRTRFSRPAWSPAHARSFILLNLVGASILAVNAYVEEQWGFLLLEAVWAVIAGRSLVRLANRGGEIVEPS